MRASVVRLAALIQRVRRPHLAARRIIEIRRHNAYDRSTNVIEKQRLVNDVRVTAEMALPETVA